MIIGMMTMATTGKVMNDPDRAIRAVPWSVEDWKDFHDSIEAFKRRFVERRHGCGLPLRRPQIQRPPSWASLTTAEAKAVEDNMRRMENDPSVTKRELRLFMQTAMPCGHAAGNLLTCPTPPYGCVLCLQRDASGAYVVPESADESEQPSRVSTLLDELGVPGGKDDETRLRAYATEMGRRPWALALAMLFHWQPYEPWFVQQDTPANVLHELKCRHPDWFTVPANPIADGKGSNG